MRRSNASIAVPTRAGRRGFLALCGTTALAGCSTTLRGTSSQPSFGWSSVAADAANTGAVEASLAPTGSSPAWTEDLAGRPRTSPVATETQAFVGTTAGVTAVEASSGDRDWHAKPSGVPAATPAVADEVLVVPTVRRTPADGPDEAAVHALDVTTGEELWARPLDADDVLAPTVAGDAVLVRAEGSLLSLALDDGEVDWHRDGFDPFDEAWDVTKDVAPAVADGTVFAPGPRGVTAVDAGTGEEKWHLDTRKLRAAPAVRDGTLYVPDTADGLRAVDARTGEPRWEWHDSGCWTSPTVTGGAVYLTAGFDVVALDPSDGTERWRTDGTGLRADTFASVAASERRIVACSDDVAARVYDVGDPGTGSVAREWEHAGSGTVFSPALASGRVLAVDGGTLVAFGDA